MSIKEKQNFQTSQGFKETSTFKPLNENEIAEFARNCHSKNIPIEIKGTVQKPKLEEIFNLKS